MAHLVLAENVSGELIGFLGAENGRFKMLFLAAEARGFGLKKQLLRFGIGKFGISELTVNEQNLVAVGFYERMGFATYKHIEFNEQSNPHPLLCIRYVGIEYINS